MTSALKPQERRLETPVEPVVLSGMRSTDELHLGHFFGVIDNWLDLQKRYDQCFFFAADWHALTTDYHDPSHIAGARRANILDWLACGIDPNRSTIFIQSRIKEIAELNLLFSMITPVGWLERNPTYKEQREQLGDDVSGSLEKQKTPKGSVSRKKDTTCLGFFSYPVLQAADIAIVRGTLVPVGEDQLPHLELNREMIRRFAHLYGKAIFPEPKALLTQVPKLLGTDNRKMSKSYGNFIALSEPPAAVEKKIKSMVSDKTRVHRGDPGHPEDCNVFSYQKLMTHKVGGFDLSVPEIETNCRSGALGCGDCKANLSRKVNAFLDPIRNKRAELTASPKFVDDIIAAGCTRVQTIAGNVMNQTREALGI